MTTHDISVLSGGAGKVVSRQLGRKLAQLDGATTFEVARAQGLAEVQGAKVDAVALVAQRAMQGVAFVSQIELQLGQAVPIAVTRLQAIGDLAALGMGQVVMDSVTAMRSCR